MAEQSFVIYKLKNDNSTDIVFKANWDIRIIGNDCGATYEKCFWKEEDWEYVIKKKYKKKLVNSLVKDYPDVMSNVISSVENKTNMKMYNKLSYMDIIVLLSFREIFNKHLSYRKISEYLRLKNIPISESLYYW